MTRHLEPRARRRRWPWIVAASVFLIGSVAAAVFFSRKDTAPQTIQVAAIGTVDIGDRETLGWFDPATLADDWQLGTTIERCAVVTVDATGATSAGDFRLYSAAIGGDLPDYLEMTVAKAPTTSVLSGVPFSCGADGVVWEPVYAGTMTGLPDTYETGIVLGAPQPGAVRGFNVMVTVTLPDNAATQAETSGKTASVSLAFENR